MIFLGDNKCKIYLVKMILINLLTNSLIRIMMLGQCKNKKKNSNFF